MKKIKCLLGLIAFFAFFSCAEDYQTTSSAETMYIATESSTKLVGQVMIFNVKTNAGTDITSDATIYVNDSPIAGNSFSSTTVGNFVVKAEYSGVSTEPITVNFHDGTQVNFVKRVLIEDYTGTWCGYCTRVAQAIDMVHNQTDKSVPVAIHRESSNPANANYDPFNFDASPLESIVNIPGYPKALLNRMTQWSFPEPNNIGQAITLTQGANPKLGLAVSSTVSSGNINMDVKVKFSKNFSDLKLVVYVLENGLIYKQKNYTAYYGGVNPITNFTHNHVLRACITPIMGEAINSQETHSGNVYTKTFNVPVPSNVSNIANVEFVAFIVGADNKAINVRKSAQGEQQTFEEL